MDQRLRLFLLSEKQAKAEAVTYLGIHLDTYAIGVLIYIAGSSARAVCCMYTYLPR